MTAETAAARQEHTHKAALTDGSVKLGLDHVTKAFGPLTAVRDLTFSVGEGEFLSVVGPSGCGKSTILNMAAGLDEPTSGTVTLDGTRVDGPRRAVGFMLQKDLLLPWRSVRRNVEFGLETQALSRTERSARAMNELQRTKLEAFADHYPHQLSGGMRQRVALARTLAIQPDLILLDEPFSSLDAQTKLLLQKSFAATIREAGVTAVLITHDLQEAVIMADRVLVLSGRPGTIVDAFHVDLPERTDLMARAMHENTRQYVNRLFQMLHLTDAA